MSKIPTFLDLFAGAGGLSLGMQKAGFELIAATDWDHWSCETLRSNHPDIPVIEGDITQVNLNDFKKLIKKDYIDVIVGGPPCQGFSQLGKRDKNDPRNQLWREYLKFVDFFNPKIFVMENVPQILTSDEYSNIKASAEALGYQVEAKVLHAVDFGVPQKRKRAIIIGSRIGLPVHPEPTHTDPAKISPESELKVWRVLADVISDLSIEPDEVNLHVKRNPTPLSLERYKHIPPGGNRFDLPEHLTPNCWKKKKTGSTDVFGRLEWNKPALTIRTEFYKPEKGKCLHPEAHRPITLREAARIQTFPDNYLLEGSHVQVAKQIGNAVPVELGNAIGRTLLNLLNAESYRFNKDVVNRSTALQR